MSHYSVNKAVECLKNASTQYQSIEEFGDASDCLSEAGDILKADNPQEACQLYKQCAQLYVQVGKCADVTIE